MLGVGGASAVPSASTPSGQSFAAIADASVLAGRMQQNFGGAKDLVVGPGTRSRALMRFRLHGLRGFVLGADLRVFVRSGRGAALAARVAGKKWTESRVVYASAPRALGPAVHGVVGAAGAWTTLDVTRLVHGSGTLSLSISASRAVRLVSREGGRAPRVIVRTGPAQPTPAGPCGTRSRPPATYAHVIWIFMENHSYGQVIGRSSAPYENQLAALCGLATNYKGITHPSLPNYIAATSGDTQGVNDDKGPSSHRLTAASIFSQVKAAGGSWRSYLESMPRNCALSSSGSYAVKHNPAAYYVPIRTDCNAWDVPMGTISSGAFATDLAKNTLPSFSFITPNTCNDTHDCPVATGDAWLQSWIPKITSSPAYKSGETAIFLTWDEDDMTPVNQVATFVITPTTAPGARSGTAFNHYSLLKTTEQMLGINTYLGHAADAHTSSMRSAFKF